MRAATLLAWRSLSSLRSRTLLTATGVVLGVALVMSILVTLRSVGTSFAPIQGRLGDAALAVVPSKLASGLPADAERTLAGTPGVGGVLVQSTGQMTVSDRSHTFGLWYVSADMSAESAAHTYRLTAGSPGLVIEETAAAAEGIKIGDELTLGLGSGEQGRLTVTGLAAYEGLTGAVGGAEVIIDRGQFQAAFGHPPATTRLLILPAGGTSPGQLVQSLKGQFQVQEQLEVRGADIPADFTGNLIFFAAIATLVAGFLIFGNFTLTIQERTAQIAMTLAIGATRAQVTAALALETLGVGFIGSVLGIPAGISLSKLMIWLATYVRNRHQPFLTVGTSDVVIAMAAGIGVSLLAGLWPAVRAGRISPLEALRVTADEKVDKVWTALAGLVVAIVSCIALLSFSPKDEVILVQSLAALYFIGIALAVPLLIRLAVSHLLEPMARRSGPVLKLAIRAMSRNTSRAALTVCSMMVAIAMLITVSGITSSMWGGADAWLESMMAGDLVLTGRTMTTDTLEAARRVPGVAVATGIGTTDMWMDSGLHYMARWVEPAGARAMLPFRLAEGNREAALNALERGDGVILSEMVARKNGIHVGDVIGFRNNPDGKSVPLKVAGLLSVGMGGGGDIFVSRQVAERYFSAGQPISIMVKLEPGAGGAAAEEALRQLSDVHVQSFQSYKQAWHRTLVEGAMAAIHAILYITLLMSALGIVNTLLMSVLAQRRELALLRAVGATREQIQAAVVLEAVLLGAAGTILGTAAGSFLALAAVRGPTVDSNILLHFVYPAKAAVLIGLGALALAAVSAVVPAGRAGQVVVMDALRAD